MASVNVNRSVSDQFYRYKMPRLLAKVEGKGNGIKTVIVNMVDVAKALNRPPTYPTKYFGCELGAQTQFDFKNDRFIVNGSHDSIKLQSLLDGFIKRFVLCPECDNPETDLWPHAKKQTISQQCKACGYNGAVDMRHRLTTFILKNPPDQNPSTVGASLTVPKEKRKSKRKGEKGKNNGSMSPQADKGDSDNEIWSTDKNDSDDDWAVDTSEEAVAKRMEDLTDGAKGITLNDDLERSQQERLEIFYNFVKKLKEEGRIEGQDKEIAGEAERLDVKDKGTIVLSELLFDDKMVAQIVAHRILFLRFTNSNQKAQKYLLGGFEQLVNVYRAALLPKVPHVLKAFYDNDILEEEVLLEWGSKVSKKYVAKELAQDIHDKAAPFVKWLKEAEEEEEDDDSDDDQSDDEDNLEVVYTDRVLPSSKVTKPIPAKAAEDDIDIDAI